MFDHQCLEISTCNYKTVKYINKYVKHILKHEENPQRWIELAIEADPFCALAYALAALYYLRIGVPKKAENYIVQAEKYQDQTTKRESLTIKAAQEWLGGDKMKCMETFEEILRQYPTDILIVKEAQILSTTFGEHRKMLEISQMVLEENRETHYMHGIHAFALEECQKYDEAEKEGRIAIEMHAKDPWAQHAVAHVLYFKQRIDEGIEWLQKFRDTWSNCDSFLYPHCCWHLALFYIEKNDPEKILHLYDYHIWCTDQGNLEVQQSALGLLLRLQLMKIPFGDRLKELLIFVSNEVNWCKHRLFDFLAIEALIMDNNPQGKKLLSQFIEKNKEWAQFAEGIAFYAQQEYIRAVPMLKSMVGKIEHIGGSLEQVDIFYDIYIDALVQAKEYQQVEEFIKNKKLQTNHNKKLLNECIVRKK